MADVYKGLTVKLGVDTSSLSSALRKARSEVSGVATDLRKVERALKLDPGNVFQPALPMRGVTAILCAKFTASINI